MRHHYLAFTASHAAEPKQTTTVQFNTTKAHKVLQGPTIAAGVPTNWTELVDKNGIYC